MVIEEFGQPVCLAELVPVGDGYPPGPPEG
jgi:hypothetical protein